MEGSSVGRNAESINIVGLCDANMTDGVEAGMGTETLPPLHWHSYELKTTN